MHAYECDLLEGKCLLYATGNFEAVHTGNKAGRYTVRVCSCIRVYACAHAYQSRPRVRTSLLNEKVEFLIACAYADAKDAQCATAEYKLGVAGARTLTSAVDSKCR